MGEKKGFIVRLFHAPASYANYMKFSESLWTRALDLKMQVKQTEEKKSLSFRLFSSS